MTAAGTIRAPSPAAFSPLRIGALAAAALALAPLIAVVGLALTRPASAAIPVEVILRYARDTSVLATLVALGACTLGASAAWLVVMHRFPGRDLFAWALALPLAAPAYALAYAYADLLDVAGPVRTALRTAGIDAWPFEVRSLPGAAAVLSCAFYPYVYLTARAAFVSQSVCALEAARSLGSTPWDAFRRVALPLARPALAAGAALAVMETLADYGAVNFLGVQTLTTGVVRAWAVYGAPGSAARISLILLGAAAVLLWIERLGRREQGYAAASARWRTLTEVPLRGPAAWAASGFCLLLLVLALLLPAGWLAWKGLSISPELPRIVRAGAVTLGLGLAGAVVTVGLAAVIAFGGRGRKLAQRLVSLGYSTPGAVMAVGLLAPAALVWKGANGAVAGLGLLILAYAARLMAAALEPIDAGLARITPSMDRAARSLGESEAGAVRRVHVPLASASLWTAALLVFVDVVKELPATLILRPFNFDTLAVLADRYAADERLAEAAWPALAIVLIAAPAMIVLSRQVMASRPGGRA
ncbi:MAG: iron ABC transporter permease [Phenylobacterium sp.]|uniref:ABC transporter permease n=1 Tax=Phenylobacterium sp. TaxID=1871053 RepID=UPI002A35C279|nr:iron ABC transporter permease [Phenylobacterium sp.]MDX9997709.1 iron ABC transporter permease [Phenylobacterium sp.]